MSKFRQTFWLLTLVFFLGGCSASYRPVKTSTMGDSPDPDPELSQAASLEPGDQLRLILAGGERLEGWVVALDRETLEVEGEGEFPVPRTLAWADIRELEVRQAPHRKTKWYVILASAALVTWVGYEMVQSTASGEVLNDWGD